MLLGAALRLWQYFANSSLWIDEAALGRNIIERSTAALFGPLDFAQSAPIGFLLIEKTIAGFAGTSEFALRAFPVVCGLASLLLFWSVSRKVLTGWAVPFAVALFSLGIPFIYFSALLKQYSSDIAVALLVLLVTLDTSRRGVTARRAGILAIIGAAAVWLSQSTLFVVAGIGVGLLILSLLDPDRWKARQLSLTWTLWTVSAVAATAYSLSALSDLDRDYLRWFWGEGFMKMPPESLWDLGWLPRRVIWIFGAFAPGLGHTNGGLNYRWSPVFAIVMMYGYWALWREQRDAALFLMLPVAFVVFLSAAGVYPFTARLIAFLVPYLLLATAAGANHLLTHVPRRLEVLTVFLLAVLGGAPLFAVATALPPSWVQHLRPVIAHISEEGRESDRIYVYYGAGVGFGYYAPRFGIASEHVVRGRCALEDPRSYLRELDLFRGQSRVWVVFTHEQREGELELVRGYLDRIGVRQDTISVPASNGRSIEHAYGFLYDLSGRARLASATAANYPLPASFKPVSEAFKRWGCYGITGGEPRAPSRP